MLTPSYVIPDLETEQRVQFVKQYFGAALRHALQLHTVFAPLFVLQHTGINDDLNGNEAPVTFRRGGNEYAIVHSLAKWKRMRLKELCVPMYEGIVTHMLALRPDEAVSEIHSVLVDQWDWEMVIGKADRNLFFLQSVVRKIYRRIRQAELAVRQAYPEIQATLPEKITFIHAEELQERYPDKTPREREDLAVKEYGAVFLTGIGSMLADGRPHDGRAADYDDWSTPTYPGYKGLNGDILLWHPVLQRSFEVSSMGIRVDKEALLRQLEICGAGSRSELAFHRLVLNDDLPFTIGGGIGQSRMAMFLLKQPHIGMVQYCYP